MRDILQQDGPTLSEESAGRGALLLDPSTWYASLEAIPHGIVLTDHQAPDEPIVFANKAFAVLTGYSKDEVIGRNCRFLQGNDRAQSETNLLQSALRESNAAEVILRNYRKDGSMFINRLTVSPLFNRNGVVTHFIGIQHDMTKEVELVKVVKRGRVELTRFFQESRDLLITINRRLVVKRINPVAEQLLKRPGCVGSSAVDVLPNQVIALVDRVCSGHSNELDRHQSLRIQHSQGRMIQWSIYPVPGGDILVMGIEVNDRDEQHHLVITMNEQRAMLDSATDGFINLDHEWRIVYLNRKAEELLGRSRDELFGFTLSEVYPESVRSRFYAEYKQAVLSNEPRNFTEFNTTVNRWLNVHCFPHADGLSLLFRDLTEEAELHARLSYLAEYDSVTGLPNRHTCLAHLERLVSQRSAIHANSGDSAPLPLAVLYLDLDKFKDLNDTVGHVACDAFLAEVGQRIASELPATAFLGRISGDEYMVAVEGLEESELMELAFNIVKHIAEPFTFSARSFSASGSIGIAVYPQAGSTAGQLVQNADTAMYFAKRSGRGSVRFYSIDLARSEADRLRLYQELQKCVDLDQLELYYQPKFDLKTGNLIGSEALLRWNHPTRGLLGPTEFIAVAEESGLIVDIGLWVLKEACIQAAAWRESGLAAYPRVDINLSSRQLMDSEFPTMVSAMLSKYNLDGNAIGLEITESMLSVDMDQAARVLEAFRSMGLPVALDDFGTGYSNLSYIQRFPITTLKIDKSFVQKIETSNNSRALVSGIISMARALQLEVVAEGVETAAQLKFLLLQQCDAMQGYLASPAVPAAEFRDRFLREERQVNILDTFGDGN